MIEFLSARTSVQTNCGYSATNIYSGHFTSPNYPSNYGNGENCYWTLTSDERISLSFEAFNTEASYDYVRVYDGSSSSASLLGAFHGQSIPSSLTSSSTQMYVTFTSDGSNTYSGFSAKYEGEIIVVLLVLLHKTTTT